MARRLTPAEVAAYEERGFHFPVPVLSEAEAAACRARLEAFEREQGHPLQGKQRIKTNLLFPWMDELMRDPRILDPVESIIGPDILCWGAHMFVKEASSPAFVTWHQDHQYWGLDSGSVMTAWLALSPASLEAGCMFMAPGTHRKHLPHEDTFESDNMLTRGQRVVEGIDEDAAVAMPLRTGEMSLHNVRIAHSSKPNRTPDRRIGIAFRFMPASTRQQLAEWDSASLVRGRDHGNFVPEPRPTRDMDPECIAFHTRAVENELSFLYPDAARQRREFVAS